MISAAKKSAMKSVTPAVVGGVVCMRKEIEPFTTTTTTTNITTATSRCPSDTNKEKDGMIQNSIKERQEENQSKNSSETSETTTTTTTTNVENVENGRISNTTTTTTTTASNDDNDNDNDSNSDSDSSSLVIGDVELDCTTSPSIENWISEYQSHIIPNVIHQHYPTITTTATTSATTTTGPSDQDGTLQIGDPTKTIVSVLGQLDSSTSQQNGGAETNTMIETPQRSFIGRKRSPMTQQRQQQQRQQQRQSPMTARMRKKNRTHETVCDQFEDAFEARQLKPVPPPNANFAQNHHHQHHQQQQLLLLQQQQHHQQQQQGHWGGTNPNYVSHPFSNMTSVATAGIISGNAMTINPHEPFRTHQLLYNAAMGAAQEQQTQIIQQSKRRPKTQQEMILMQAELDLVAAYQRVEALKQSSSSSMGIVAAKAAASTNARTTTNAAAVAAAGGGVASANTGHRHHP
ncbi:hypothetical protein IV203_019270 [Nitzschia inconspicua]|uniref:Uncharacterized protein n=1 Tax=Nitzschia inconspicua TaxID=303405 RepID=A0A9K3LYB6_9STRA|nr:hypothetical protein IV203_019270 [Nitzschia inconspicua]